MLSITIPPVMEALLDEATNDMSSRDILDCADLMAIALLDSRVRALIGEWGGTRVSYTNLVWFLKHHKADEVSEHAATVYRYNSHEIRLTGLAGFVLRFVVVCDTTVHSLLLLSSGLLEVHPPSVSRLLHHFGLDARIMSTRLSEGGIIMCPQIEGIGNVHFQDIWGRFFHWRMSNADDIVDDLGDPRRCVDLMIKWLDMEYEELDVTSPLHRGDVVLLVYDNVRRLCVLDRGGLWRDLVDQRVIGILDIPRLAVKHYRDRGSGGTMNRVSL